VVRKLGHRDSPGDLSRLRADPLGDVEDLGSVEVEDRSAFCPRIFRVSSSGTSWKVLRMASAVFG